MLSRNVNQPVNVPPNLARTLLAEFGKTRTSYSTLVPNIIEVMRIYKDFPDHCPIPIVTKLDDLLTEAELSRIERQYPQSVENGFLVLCTERRALKSGGGGKYYFIDSTNRLVGCPKGDLARHAQKGVLSSGPVLLKNLIFVFIMRGVDGLGCKSSNPKRLLEFYEAMTQQGSAADIRYLLRVWSMEVHVDYGNFPPCSLLWIKQMDLENHVQKWRDSQYQNNQRQVERAEVSALNEVAFQTAMRMYHEDGHLNENFCPPSSSRNSLREHSFNLQRLDMFSDKLQHPTMTPQTPAAAVAALNEWIGTYQFPFSACETLYQNFSEIVPFLQPHHIIEWSHLILEKLNDSILAAATELIATTFCVESLGEFCDREVNKNAILESLCNLKERERLAEGLRILLACLVQQNRIDQLPLDTNPVALLNSATTTPSQTTPSGTSMSDPSESMERSENVYSISETIFPPVVDQFYYQNDSSVTASMTDQSASGIPKAEQQQHEVLNNNCCQQTDAYWNPRPLSIDVAVKLEGPVLYPPPLEVMIQHYGDVGEQKTEVKETDSDNGATEEEEEKYEEIDVLQGRVIEHYSSGDNMTSIMNTFIKASEGSTETSSLCGCAIHPFETIQ